MPAAAMRRPTMSQVIAAVAGPMPEGVSVPTPPTFDSVEEERRYRKEQLAAGFRLFGRFGFSEGVAGHITVRDPENPDAFWVNPPPDSVRGDPQGVVSDAEEGRRIGAALSSYKAVILQNHGLLTVGQSVAEAVWWFITMELSCQAQLLAMAAATPKLIDRHTALHTRAQVGGHCAGWFQAQPLWDRSTASDPDLFD